MQSGQGLILYGWGHELSVQSGKWIVFCGETDVCAAESIFTVVRSRISFDATRSSSYPRLLLQNMRTALKV